MKRLFFLTTVLAVLLTAVMCVCSLPACAEAGSPASTLWYDLETRREVDAEGEISFSLNLSEAQAAELEHAELLVVERLASGGGITEDYQRLWVEDLSLEDGGRRISCPYPNRALYVVDDADGEILAGPLDFFPTKDGDLALYVIFARQAGIGWDESTAVFYRYTLDRESGAVSITSVTTADDPPVPLEVDDAFLQEHGYVTANIYTFNRIPEYAGGSLLPFSSWPKDEEVMMFKSISLPRSWRLEAEECQIPRDRLFVFFQLTDRQGETHASSLCPLDPEALYPLDVREEAAPERTVALRQLSASLYRDSGLFVIEMQPDYPADGVRGYRADGFVINDRNQATQLSFSAWNGQKLLFTLSQADLLPVGQPRSLDFVLTVIADDYGHLAEEHVRLLFDEDPSFPWKEQEPPATDEVDGITWDLLELSFPDAETVRILFAAEETQLYEQPLELVGVAFEDWYCPFSLSSRLTLRGHSVLSRLETVSPHWRLSDSSRQEWLALESPPGELGIDEVRQLRLFYRLEGSEEIRAAVLELKDALPCPWAGGQAGLHDQSVLDKEQIELVYEQSAVFHDEKSGKNVAALGFWLRNRSENLYTATLDSFRCNDRRADNGRTEGSVDCVLPGNTSQYVYLKLETDTPLEELQTAQFTLFIRGLLEEEISLDLRP